MAQHSLVRLASRPSALSGGTGTLVSKKSKAGLSSSRVCPYAANWFTIPNVSIKLFLCLFSVILLGLMLSWESEGITIFDLNDNVNQINYRNPIYCYLGIAILTVLYSVFMTIFGCGGFNILPITQALVTGAFLFVWLVSSAVISASMDTIGHTQYARDRGLDILLLKVANVFGFLNVISFTFDILLAFIALRDLDEATTADQELIMRESKSIPSVSGRFATGKGSYRHRQSLSFRSSQDTPPVILKEGTPIAHL